jgi:N-acetyl-anhydromuramyl-L-alanine amidase AmpD
MGPIRGVVVHGTRSGRLGNPTEGIGTVNYCTQAGTTSYHQIVDVDGTVYELVPWGTAAWHAGRLNHQWLGIALAQSTEDDPITDAQHRSLEWLLRKAAAHYGFPYRRVFSEAESGITQHMDTQQGRSFGKSDVGKHLSWARLGL